MKILTINDKEYKFEFSFEAAEYKDCVQNMFKIVTGAYIAKSTAGINDSDEAGAASAMIDGISDMVSDIPSIVKTCFYAGMMENNPIELGEVNSLLRSYMKAEKLSYNKMFEIIKECMEEDGFFDLSGLTEMMETFNQSMNAPVKGSNRKKKSTSTK